jgi:hypothetical protein
MEFGIRAWAACAPEIESPEAWRAWSLAPWLPVGDTLAPVTAMAPMVRRRVQVLGRAALHPAYAAQPGVDGIPAIFASRHGDTALALQMLGAIARGEPVSPTSFSLAVHNAIGALYSIDRVDRANLQALAAGRDTVEAALVEACGLLADGADEVLLVHYETLLPPPYAVFADEPQCLFGWAWRVGRPVPGETRYRLETGDAPGPRTQERGHATLPHGLEVLRFMLAGARELTHAGERSAWRWTRHD